MELFRPVSFAGELLKVRVLAGFKVLVSASDPDDLVQLQNSRPVRFVRSALEARFSSLQVGEVCECGFILEDGGLRICLQDLADGAVLQVLPA